MNEFLKNGFVFLPNFIDRDEAYEIGKGYIQHSAKYNLKKYSTHVSNYRVAVDEYINYKPIFELLLEKQRVISDIVGESLLPTYSYIRTYKVGNFLTPHVDKPACEISLTVHLYHDVHHFMENKETIDPKYPFVIESLQKKKHKLDFNTGDAVLYLGCEVMHGRPKMKLGYRYVQSFLHYVREFGQYKDRHEINKIFYPENMRSVKDAEAELR